MILYCIIDSSWYHLPLWKFSYSWLVGQGLNRSALAHDSKPWKWKVLLALNFSWQVPRHNSVSTVPLLNPRGKFSIEGRFFHRIDIIQNIKLIINANMETNIHHFNVRFTLKVISISHLQIIHIIEIIQYDSKIEVNFTSISLFLHKCNPFVQ